MTLAGTRHLHVADHPEGLRAGEREDVVPNVRAELAADGAAVAHGQPDDAARLAGKDEHGAQARPTFHAEAQHVIVFNAHRTRVVLTDGGDIIPRHQRHRVRVLLQPAVVGKAAVIHLRARPNRDGEGAVAARRRLDRE